MLSIFQEYNPFRKSNKDYQQCSLINEAESLLNAENSLYSNPIFNSPKFGRLRIKSENEVLTFDISNISHPLESLSSLSTVDYEPSLDDIPYEGVAPYTNNGPVTANEISYNDSCITSINDTYCSISSHLESSLDPFLFSGEFDGFQSSGEEYLTACNSLQFELSTTLVEEGLSGSPYLTFAHNDLIRLQLAHDYHDHFADQLTSAIESIHNGSPISDTDNCLTEKTKSIIVEDVLDNNSNNFTQSSRSSSSGKVEILRKYEEINKGYNLYMHGIQPHWKLVLTDSVIFRKGRTSISIDTPMGDVLSKKMNDKETKEMDEELDMTLKPDSAEECSENDVPVSGLLCTAPSDQMNIRVLPHGVIVDDRLIDHEVTGCLACTVL